MKFGFTRTCVAAAAFSLISSSLAAAQPAAVQTAAAPAPAAPAPAAAVAEAASAPPGIICINGYDFGIKVGYPCSRKATRADCIECVQSNCSYYFDKFTWANLEGSLNDQYGYDAVAALSKACLDTATADCPIQ